MLENIIGHAGVVGALRAELAADRLPRAILFAGPAYSGKLSAALEVARALTCTEGSAAWSCECPSCRSQKELLHPHTVLLGARYSDVEIAASADALLRTRRPAGMYLFVRAVRKLTRRFDPAIADGDDPRVKGALEKVARVEELLAEFPPGGEVPAEKPLAAWTEKVCAAAVPLTAALRADGIAVGQVRVLSSWAHLTAAGSRKIAILESADRMQDSARNALLKLLEEPPEAVHLLLLASRRGAIVPTVLSRLRPYLFEQRPPAEEREVMSRIFRIEDPGADSLREFFLAWKPVSPGVAAGLADRLLRLAADPQASTDIIGELPEVFPARGAAAARPPRETTLYLLEEIGARMRALLRGGAELDLLEEWRDALREARQRVEVLNMAPAAALESLYLRMREASRARPVAHGGAA